jgi:hypothetical protein
MPDWPPHGSNRYGDNVPYVKLMSSDINGRRGSRLPALPARYGAGGYTVLNRASDPGDVHDRIAVRLSTLNQSPRRYFINQLYELLTESARFTKSASTAPTTRPQRPQTYDYAVRYDLA